MDFRYKVALVTGGGTGIGRAVCIELARRGAAVGINYSRSEAEAEATMRQIDGEGGRTLLLRADVSIEQEVNGMTVRPSGYPGEQCEYHPAYSDGGYGVGNGRGLG